MNRKVIAGMLLASFFFWIVQYVYVPILPDYARDRVADLGVVGVVPSMYGLLQMLVRIPLSVAVDATRRVRHYLIGGFVAAGAGAMTMRLGGSTGVLALGRVLTGVAAGTWVPMIVLFASFYPPERMTFAISLITFDCHAGEVVEALAGDAGHDPPSFPGAFDMLQQVAPEGADAPRTGGVVGSKAQGDLPPQFF